MAKVWRFIHIDTTNFQLIGRHLEKIEPTIPSSLCQPHVLALTRSSYNGTRAAGTRFHHVEVNASLYVDLTGRVTYFMYKRAPPLIGGLPESLASQPQPARLFDTGRVTW